MTKISNEIIQSLWIGNELTTFEQLSISSFIANGHLFHLYCYNEIQNVPKGTTLMDANEIIPQNEVFKTKRGSYAIFADWFRWELLFRHGHFWVDTDMICLKPFEFDAEVIFGREDDNITNIGVLKFPPSHAVTRHMADACLNPHKFQPYDTIKDKRKKLLNRIKRRTLKDLGWGKISGPQHFTKVIQHFNLHNSAKPSNYFYPIHYENLDALFDSSVSLNSLKQQNVYGLHLWNEMFRCRDDIDKNGKFPPTSLIEQLKNRYL
jgi:hypothetical protein